MYKWLSLVENEQVIGETKLWIGYISLHSQSVLDGRQEKTRKIGLNVRTVAFKNICMVKYS